MARFLFALSFVALSAFLAQPVLGQDIVIDWETKKLMASPAEISKVTNVKIVVKNVNDVLYSYDINLVAAPRAFADYEALLNAAGGGPAGDPTNKSANCKGLIEQLNSQTEEVKKAVKDMLGAPIQQDGKFKSILLSETRQAWFDKDEGIGIRADALDLLATRLAPKAVCDGELDAVKQMRADALQRYGVLKQALALLIEKLNGSHEFVRTVTLNPDHDYRVIVEESFTRVVNGVKETKLTEGGRREFTFSPTSNVLVVTAGALLTTIEQRAYLSRKDPSQQEKTVLAIDGTGAIRPIGVALLNYQIPSARFGKGSEFGISLASGLTFEFGATKSETAKLGWFGGFSVDIYRRLYISPGIHFGEFADFPVGLARGSIIPENFGDVNPVKRWTGRFAIAVTYRTAGVGKTSDTGGKQKE